MSAKVKKKKTVIVEITAEQNILTDLLARGYFLT